ncbi:MAG: Crp/Fnr family transcriptional regulator [Syntrophobacteria bacterium]
MDEVAGFPADAQVFRGFDKEQIEKIVEICQPVHFREGQVIVEKNNRDRDLYILVRGRVNITLSEYPGKHDAGTLTKCNPGGVFGELSFIDGSRRSAHVVAIEDVDALRLTWDDFSGLVRSDLKICCTFFYNLALVIADRLRNTTFLCSNLLGMR